MLHIANLLFPILIIIALGYAAGKYKILPPEAGDILTRFLFFFSLPCLTFSNIYHSNLSDLLNLRFLLTFLCSILILILVQGILYSRVFHIHGQELVLLTMGGFYINAVYMGVPVTTLILGSVIPPMIPLFLQAAFFFPLTIYLMDRLSGNKPANGRFNSLFLLLKNPVLVACALAAISLIFKIRYPDFLIETASLMGKPAAATGLFALGFTSNLPAGSAITKHEAKMATIAALFKVIGQPLVVFLLGKFVFRLDSWWTNAAVICAMLPTAVNHFIVSQKYQSCGNESRLIILLTTFGSCILLSLFLLTVGAN